MEIAWKNYVEEANNTKEAVITTSWLILLINHLTLRNGEFITGDFVREK